MSTSIQKEMLNITTEKFKTKHQASLLNCKV